MVSVFTSGYVNTETILHFFSVKHTYFQSPCRAKRILKARGSSVQVIDIMGGKNWTNLQSFWRNFKLIFLRRLIESDLMKNRIKYVREILWKELMLKRIYSVRKT